MMVHTAEEQGVNVPLSSSSTRTRGFAKAMLVRVMFAVKLRKGYAVELSKL